MNQLLPLEKRMEDAEKALCDEVNRLFPIGSRVMVADSIGRTMPATVAFESNHQGYLKVRSRHNVVHHKHWSCVRPADVEEAYLFEGLMSQ